MADIRRLDGSPVETKAPFVDPRVRTLFDELRKKLDNGRVVTLAYVGLSPEGWIAFNYAWPSQGTEFSRPGALSLIGALHNVADEISAGIRGGAVTAFTVRVVPP